MQTVPPYQPGTMRCFYTAWEMKIARLLLRGWLSKPLDCTCTIAGYGLMKPFSPKMSL